MQLDTTDIYTKKTLGEITRFFIIFYINLYWLLL